MRLHLLEIEAFGPFAQICRVDLDAVSSTGLFLVHGPTGSGKTSLIDAICFALFADVPGARTKKGLRSDHAAPGAVPRVLLELTVGGRRLRIERSPEYLRPKKRGQGLLRVQAKVVLQERVAGTWHVRSSRHDEVADLIDQLLGLGLAQFATVAVLPQGEFAAFLRATPEDRRTILERLFDITTYRGVEDWLVEERRRSTAVVDALADRVQAQVVRLEDALATAPGRALDVDANAAPDHGEGRRLPTPAELDALVSALDADVLATMTGYDSALGAERVARHALESARLTAAARGRGESALLRQRELADQSQEQRLRRERLDAARRAEVVRGHQQALDIAIGDVRVARDLVEAHAKRASLDPDLPASTIEARLDNARGYDEIVAQLAAAVDGVEPAVAATREAGTASETASATVVHAQQAAQAHARDVQVAEAALERLLTAADDVAALQSSVHRWTDLVALRTAVDADQAAHLELRERVVTAAENAVSAQDQVLQLRRQRIEGMAAELAGSLVEGAPCLVCGSPEHPRPATAERVVTQAQITRAEQHAARAEQLRGALDLEREGVRVRLEERRSRLPDDRSVGDVRLERDRAIARLDVAEQQSAACAEALARVTALRQAAVVADRQLGLALQEHARITGNAEAAQRALSALVERMADLDIEHGTCPCVPPGEVATRGGQIDHENADEPLTDVVARAATIVLGHRVHAHALTGVRQAHDDLRESEQRRQRAGDALDRALAASGFQSAQEALNAGIDPAVHAAMHAASLAFDESRIAADTVLADPEVVAALETPLPDVEALAVAADLRRTELLAASAQQSRAQQCAEAVRRLSPALVEALTSLAPAAERAALVRSLADTVTGIGAGNDLRMRLTAFVLAARLEKIVELANERLAVMGSGRYLLEHSDDLASGGRRSGLGLKVLDQWTGQSRETSSLSGGETFMASLALALGLADAVREESGGADLATLFVDEGFGSLDEDSLEEVLGVLDSLREGGRAVAVVSHVAELKVRITHQIVVDKASNGSSAQICLPTSGAA